jgi:hypothetical protein
MNHPLREVVCALIFVWRKHEILTYFFRKFLGIRAFGRLRKMDKYVQVFKMVCWGSCAWIWLSRLGIGRNCYRCWSFILSCWIAHLNFKEFYLCPIYFEEKWAVSEKCDVVPPGKRISGTCCMFSDKSYVTDSTIKMANHNSVTICIALRFILEKLIVWHLANTCLSFYKNWNFPLISKLSLACLSPGPD